MEQQYNCTIDHTNNRSVQRSDKRAVDLKKNQAAMSVSGDDHVVSCWQLIQGELDHVKACCVDSDQHDLNQHELFSMYKLLQAMQTGITQDIAEFEALLKQSSHCISPDEQVAIVSNTNNMNINALTCKENEVLNIFAKGCSYNEAASLMGCKLATIQTHAKRIYKKLRVHSRSEAIYEARQLAILST